MSEFETNIIKEEDGKARIDIFEAIEDYYYGIGTQEIANMLQRINAKEIEVRIDSVGGSVTTGVAIASMLRQAPQKINVNIIGVAASIASIIALAGDTVTMSQGSFFMIHKPFAFEMGESDTLRSTADTLDKMESSIIDIYVSNIKKRNKLRNNSEEETREYLQQLVAAETWLTAAEALEIGFIDAIEGKERKIENKAAATMQNYSNKYFNRAPEGYLNRFSKMAENKNKGIWASIKAFILGNEDIRNEIAQELTEEKPAETVEQPQVSAEEIAAAQETLRLAGLLPEDEDEKPAQAATPAEPVAEEETQEQRLNRLVNERVAVALAEQRAGAPTTANTAAQQRAKGPTNKEKVMRGTKDEQAAWSRFANILQNRF